MRKIPRKQTLFILRGREDTLSLRDDQSRMDTLSLWLRQGAHGLVNSKAGGLARKTWAWDTQNSEKSADIGKGRSWQTQTTQYQEISREVVPAKSEGRGTDSRCLKLNAKGKYNTDKNLRGVMCGKR